MKLKYKGKPVHIFYRLSSEERKLAEKQIKDKAKGTASFYVMVIISTIIISSGLIVDNSAVVIGGMIIAPLIWPLLALSISIIHWRKMSLQRNIVTLIKTLILILAISFLLGLLYPLYELGDQVVLRTEPNIVDLIIAIAAGLGGAFATIYTRHSPTIFGVAVAVALVPPLCAVGILLGNGHFNLMGGALLLFLTNLIAILLSAMLVFILARFSRPKTKVGEEHRKKAIIYSVVSFFIICIPLVFLTWNVIDIAQTRIQTKELFNELFTEEELQNLQITKTNNFYTIKGQVYSDNSTSQRDIVKFVNYLSQRLKKEVHADFTVIKVKNMHAFSKD